MTDDLDEMERRCNQNIADLREIAVSQGDADADIPSELTCGEVLALIERCRAAEKERDEANAALARWPEAVEKVRENYPAASDVQFACDQITRLATEKRDA